MAGDDPNVSTAGGASGNSWAKLQILPENIGSMPYENKRLKIYAHAANHQNKAAALQHTLNKTAKSNSKYFYAPISLLNPKSARSSFNNVTKQAEMEFRVEMWNDDVEAKVSDWIKENHDPQVNTNFVQVIPFEKVIIAASSDAAQQQQPEMMYQLPRDWTPYQLQIRTSCPIQVNL